VFLQGEQIDTVSTAARSLLTKTYQVTVTDRQLTVRLQDQGGKDKNVALAALTFSEVVASLPSAARAEGESLFAVPGPAASLVPRPDVNGDSFVTPLDALLVINKLNARPAGETQGESATDDSLDPDVNGDGEVTPLDALQVVNYLNSPPPAGPELDDVLTDIAADVLLGWEEAGVWA
jgi:hypothetical protein